MTVEQMATWGALAISILSMLYSSVTHSPKEVQNTLNGMRVDHAETKRDLANLIKTVDKLAELVYAREERNGRQHR
jgi:hypothetical protein